MTTKTDTTTTTKATAKQPETTDMANKKGAATKPTMAAKKDWTFDIKHDQEIPAVVRTGRRLPFNWDSMKVGSMFYIPKEFWVEFGGLTEEQANDPARNKEAVRRNFYAWRDEGKTKTTKATHPGRAKFGLAFHDRMEKGEYQGVEVYLANAMKKAA